MSEKHKADDIPEITPAMIEAGTDAIFSVPVAEISVNFSPDDLATKVYRAMERERRAGLASCK